MFTFSQGSETHYDSRASIGDTVHVKYWFSSIYQLYTRQYNATIMTHSYSTTPNFLLLCSTKTVILF